MVASHVETVYFFTSHSAAGAESFAKVASAAPGVQWRLFQIGSAKERSQFEAHQHHPSALISFLNPYIIPSTLLTQAAGRAFNVHPALPGYPGRDPQHFAFYDGATSTGATLHRMSDRVDAGEIIDVREQSMDRAQGVMSFVEEAERLAIELLLEHLPAILANTVTPQTKRRWRDGKRTTRQQFIEMCLLDSSMNTGEIHRRIDAFFNPSFRSITMDYHGHRFLYDPVSEKES